MQENTRVKLQSVLQDLCGEDCKLEIFQEDRSDEIIVSGNYVEGEQNIMCERSNVDNTYVKRKNFEMCLISLEGLNLNCLSIQYIKENHIKYHIWTFHPLIFQLMFLG